MKIVIDIPEEDYNEIKHCLYGNGYNCIEHAKLTKNVILSVFNGTPLPKGKWEYETKPPYNPYCYNCSNCRTSHRARYNYCPSCGAEMESD